MDWTTVLGSVVGSATVVGILTFTLKQAIQKRLDLEFERLKAENQESIKERTRREAFLFDELYGPLKTAASIVYRLRNTIRSLRDALDEGEKSLGRQQLEEISLLSERTTNYTRTLSNLLEEQRAILPEKIFAILHSVKHSTAAVVNYLSSIDRRSRRGIEIDQKELLHLRRATADTFDELSIEYDLLIQEIQNAIGVKDGNASAS